MKYIRTKDNIFNLATDSKKRIFYLYSYNDYSPEDFNELINKQSDNIEDLFDKFIFDDGDGDPLILDTLEELIYWFNHSKEEQYQVRNCYGAIWTNWGLKFVSVIQQIDKNNNITWRILG